MADTARQVQHYRLVAGTVLAADLVGDLLFPVVVLLTGAVLTGLLIPAWTRGRDEHRKALEVQTELVTDMSEAVMEFVMAVQFVVLGAVTATQEEYDRAYKTWEERNAVLGTKLQVYFAETTIGLEWTAFADRVTRFYALTGVELAHRRDAAAPLLGHYGLTWPVHGDADDPAASEWHAVFGELKEAVLEEKSALIQRVMNARVDAIESPPLRERLARRLPI
jgi:hypothetical protein